MEDDLGRRGLSLVFLLGGGVEGVVAGSCFDCQLLNPSTDGRQLTSAFSSSSSFASLVSDGAGDRARLTGTGTT